MWTTDDNIYLGALVFLTIIMVFAVELIEVSDVPDLEDPFRDQDHVSIK
jgi:hypothetical protein